MIVIFGNAISSKNSKRILMIKGRRIVAKSQCAMESEKKILWQLKFMKPSWLKMIEGKEYPLKINFLFYRETDRPFDYVNICQLTLDCMVKMGFMPDDNAKYVLPSFSQYQIDRKNPRVEITVL
jgi:Holliday junction resolvase RusA-like endonuclease